MEFRVTVGCFGWLKSEELKRFIGFEVVKIPFTGTLQLYHRRRSLYIDFAHHQPTQVDLELRAELDAALQHRFSFRKMLESCRIWALEILAFFVSVWLPVTVFWLGRLDDESEPAPPVLSRSRWDIVVWSLLRFWHPTLEQELDIHRAALPTAPIKRRLHIPFHHPIKRAD
jgi:hypothetical protein